MGVTIEGDKELQTQLRNFIEVVVVELPSIAEDSVKVVQQSAKEKAPVVTGALRDSITLDSEKSQFEVVIEVGPTVDYADDVEFGGMRRAAKPFLRSAIDETEDSVLDKLVTELDKLTERI